MDIRCTDTKAADKRCYFCPFFISFYRFSYTTTQTINVNSTYHSKNTSYLLKNATCLKSIDITYKNKV